MATLSAAALGHVLTTRHVGGGSGGADKGEDGGVAGHLTPQSLANVFEALREHAGWQPGVSSLFDFGAESGRVLLHALLAESAREAAGCEVNRAHCAAAQDGYIPQVLSHLGHDFTVLRTGDAPREGRSMRSGPGLPRSCTTHVLPPPDGRRLVYDCRDGAQLADMGQATHVYAFWEGMPGTARRTLGRLYAHTPTARALVVIQRAARAAPQELEAHMLALGFGTVRLAHRLAVRQGGSGGQFQAYIFLTANRANAQAGAPAGKSGNKFRP